MSEKHTILGGKVHIYKRSGSPVWQCSTYLAGKNRRVSTKESSLARAKEIAEDWYLELRGKNNRGEIKNEPTFKQAAEQFEKEYNVMTDGQRNQQYVKDHYARLRNHLNPFFGSKGISEVTTGLVQEYRIHRMSTNAGGKPPSRSTMHHEIITLRHVLKTAQRHGWIDTVPDVSAPYRGNTKVTHRAWFSHDEYKRLYEATRKNAREAKGKAWHHSAEQLHDKILFMANTGLRPDEANGLQYRDVEIVEDDATGETILEIEVRGKRGVGYCKSTSGAVRPFERMVKRNQPEPTDRLFPADHKKKFNQILDNLNLKFDREGNRRTLYSLRHSYICFRLLEGADIYQIAKNCRTSVEMIEKHYAVHLKNSLDAAAINVRKPRPARWMSVQAPVCSWIAGANMIHKKHARPSSGLYIRFRMQNISFVWRGYFISVTDLPMSPEILLMKDNVLQSIVSAISDTQVQRLVDDGLISSNPARWTMQVKHGFLHKEIRFTRNPSGNPQIADMIYALQSKS